MTNSIPLPQPVLIPRRITGTVVAQLKLPLNALGAPFVEPAPDTAEQAAIVKWWNGCAPADQKLMRDGVAILAAPMLLADIRAYYQQKSQVRTWALAGGAADNSPWLFFAPVREEKDYHVKPVPDRGTVVNSFMGYIQAGAPVWESGIRFRCSVPEFAVLLALADVYTRAQYGALLLHQPYPTAITLADLLQGYENITQSGDQRFLAPAVAHLLPAEARAIKRDAVPAIIQQLIGHGLMQKAGDNVSWTDGGLFFTDSLHHRVCALAIDIAGANAQGALATQGALFIRGDQVLWYCDIEPAANGSVSVASVGVEQARGILGELLKPAGKPPLAKSGTAPRG